MRCDAAFGVLKRLAVAQANEGEELIKLSVAVDGERAASKLTEGKGFLRDDRRENDAHGLRLIHAYPFGRCRKHARLVEWQS
jgi:hypothetical protein